MRYPLSCLDFVSTESGRLNHWIRRTFQGIQICVILDHHDVLHIETIVSFGPEREQHGAV